MKKGLLFLALLMIAGVGCSSKKKKGTPYTTYNPAAPYAHALPATPTT